MYATIKLVDKANLLCKDGIVREVSRRHRYLNLLYALQAVHDNNTHDSDSITFHRDDDHSLEIDLSVNRVSFGKTDDPEQQRLESFNVSLGKIHDLLIAFIDKRDEAIQDFEWLKEEG